MSDSRLRREYAEQLKQGYLQSGFKQGFEAGYAKAKEDFERPHGEWKETDESIVSKARCSICNRITVIDLGIPNFCPNCGADMREEGEQMVYPEGTVKSVSIVDDDGNLKYIPYESGD